MDPTVARVSVSLCPGRKRVTEHRRATRPAGPARLRSRAVKSDSAIKLYDIFTFLGLRVYLCKYTRYVLLRASHRWRNVHRILRFRILHRRGASKGKAVGATRESSRFVFVI